MTDLRKAMVVIRKNINAIVRPEAKQLDGKTYTFKFGWDITAQDSSIYAGEQAWIPNDPNYPDDAPPWIASGDLK
jgi:hypothetical protein